MAKQQKTNKNKQKQTKIKTRKYKNKKNKTHKYYKKGGALYGTGVGANCYDPNYSIYNTRMPQLFPYKS
jgi:hypothetical protein